MLRPDHLGPALRFLRTSRQLKQHTVAEAAGVTPSMLSGYENGRKAPTLGSLERILRAMDCGLRDLVEALERRTGPALEPPAPSPLPSASSAPMAGIEGLFDLDKLLGATSPLDPDEAEAFSLMLGGYVRWLRFLRRQATPRQDPQPG